MVSKWLHYLVKKLALVTMKTKVQMEVVFLDNLQIVLKLWIFFLSAQHPNLS